MDLFSKVSGKIQNASLLEFLFQQFEQITIARSVIGVVVFVLCSSLLGFYWRHYSHRKNFNFPRAIAPKQGRQRISYEELVNATNEFRQANFLGVASSGSVYNSHRKNFKQGHQRISYEELVNATDEFRQPNLLGVGSHFE
eukprot:Gb_16395 [translate_table: standard]